MSKSERFTHPRFAARVLAACELAVYVSRGSPQDYLQRAWAAKEAAYKYLRQQDSTKIFAPSRLKYDEESTSVHGEGAIIPLHFLENEDFIYCATCHPLLQAEHSIAPIARCLEERNASPTAGEPGLSAASWAVRLLACGMIARKYRLESSNVRIAKDRWGVPYALYGTERLDARLSLTHDGPMVGVALG